MKTNIFIDCGFYRGATLRRYMDNGMVDRSWKVYAFEPNPDLDTEKHIKDFFPDIEIDLIKEAVWIADGETPFHISGREDAAGIAGTSGHTDPREVMVPCLDFSEFVAEQPEGIIICSMDIEGAEFLVLEKMIKEKTIQRIYKLEVEFHHRLTSDYTVADAQSLIRRIRNRGVGVNLKDKLV